MAAHSNRVASIDIARGLIMALMALDHARIYFTNAQFDPVSVDDTNWGYFLTRWVTHLCAPGFFFLAGLSVSLAERGTQTPAQSSWLLATRGLWLIALELTLIGFAWSFTFGWSWLGVIWSLGASMLSLAALRWLPKLVLLIAAGGLLALHNAAPVADWFSDQTLYSALYGAGVAVVPGLGPKLALFPLLPWLAMMVLGYAGGDWLTPGRKPNARRFALLGAAAIVAFAALRVVGFGAPADGGVGAYDDASRAAMSFLNVEKYPPSLQFALVTLGVLFVIIAALTAFDDKRTPAALAPLHLFGRVPFFFYVLHLYLIHGLALACATALGWPTEYSFWSGVGPNLRPPEAYGFELWGVYAAWIVALALLVPVCAWFAHIKESSGAWWTKYL